MSKLPHELRFVVRALQEDARACLRSEADPTELRDTESRLAQALSTYAEWRSRKAGVSDTDLSRIFEEAVATHGIDTHEDSILALTFRFMISRTEASPDPNDTETRGDWTNAILQRLRQDNVAIWAATTIVADTNWTPDRPEPMWGSAPAPRS